MPAITTNIEWHTSVPRVSVCPSLEKQLVSAGIESGDRYFVFSRYFPDGIVHDERPSENIVLVLMTGNYGTTKMGSYPEFTFYGLGLQRGDDQDASTWKRHGYWYAELTIWECVSKDSPSDMGDRTYSSYSSTFGKSVKGAKAKALFMRIPGSVIREFCLV